MRALYRGEVSGKTRLFGLEALARLSWNSGMFAWMFFGGGTDEMERVDGGGAGETTSSRHWATVEGRGGEPARLCGGFCALGGTDWNAWMGRASKNSWATIKGVLPLAKFVGCQYGRAHGRRRRSCAVPLGMNLMSSHHMTGMSEYLLLLRNPVDVSSIGASPQRSRCWASRRPGPASTRYTASMAATMGLKLCIVYSLSQQYDSLRQSNMRHPEHIIHQCASSRPQLDQLQAAACLPLRHPLCDHPDTHELAEELTDLGRGHKVSLLAELVPVCVRRSVISSIGGGEALSHIGSQGYRTCHLVD